MGPRVPDAELPKCPKCKRPWDPWPLRHPGCAPKDWVICNRN